MLYGIYPASLLMASPLPESQKHRIFPWDVSMFLHWFSILLKGPRATRCEVSTDELLACEAQGHAAHGNFVHADLDLMRIPLI